MNTKCSIPVYILCSCTGSIMLV